MSTKPVLSLEKGRAAWGFAKKENVKLKVDPSTLIRHLKSPKKPSSSKKPPSRRKAAVARGPGSEPNPLIVCFLKKARDAYVSFMMSVASSKNFSRAGAAIVMGPCNLDQAQYPGRRPTIPTVEELELVRAAQKVEKGPTVPQIAGPAACGRRAVFPL